ncbi:MAG: hypothetical protein HN804_02485, partial [Oceanospirillaceae bacterium]|nr:hypothetical protein [Oceanospirillaceae bacterium]
MAFKVNQDNLNIIDTLPRELQLQVFASFDELTQTADDTSVWSQTSPQRQLLQVLAASPFTAQVLSLNPQWLDHDFLTSSYTKSGLAEALNHQVAQISHELQLQQALRQFRKRHQVRLIWRNRCRLGSSAELVQELSNLADVCVANALQWLHQDTVTQWGQPMGHDGQPQSLL